MQSSVVSEERQERIEKFVTDWLSKENVPGTSIAIFRGGGTVYNEGFGARDLETNAPATEQTLFGMGSCTKSVTAVAIMQLVEEGKLSLEDNIEAFFPFFESLPGEPITVHELLCHKSGMPSDGSLSALIRRLSGSDEMSVPLSSEADLRRHVTGAAHERVLDEDRFLYYNTGFTILGRIVSQVASVPFEEYVRENILKPLKMNRSGFRREQFESEVDRMSAYRITDCEPVLAELPFDEKLYAPGGLYSSSEEFADYCRLYLNGGRVEDRRLISQESLDRMLDAHNTRTSFLDGTDHSYGYGLETRELLGKRLISHSGVMFTTTAAFGVAPELDIGVTIACNTAPEMHPSVTMLGIFAILRDRDPYSVVHRLTLERKAKSVVGGYETYRGIVDASIERDGAGLSCTIRLGDQTTEHTFFPETSDPADHSYYTITENGKREQIEFEIKDGSTHFTYKRWRFNKKEPGS